MEVIWTLFWLFLLFLVYIALLWAIRSKEHLTDYYRIPSYFPRLLLWTQANQTTGNISGHVPGQNAPPYPDAYLSIEHIIVENELNKSQKCTEAPPSYEEAMRLALAHSNSLQTYEVEQRSANQQLGANQATSSATPIAPTHQPTAVPLERF
ncbi:hypothetical protein HUJ05_012574 [Dendroctonus ponderosae]|nr:hypothetical protein HUJ05_012574 [Dendroctonus ponderosae]